jgi:hypothetical protein
MLTNQILQRTKSYHTVILAPLVLNWISPGGIFIGAQRIYFSCQVNQIQLNCPQIYSCFAARRPISCFFCVGHVDSCQSVGIKFHIPQHSRRLDEFSKVSSFIESALNIYISLSVFCNHLTTECRHQVTLPSSSPLMVLV